MQDYPVIDFRLRTPPKIQFGGKKIPEDMEIYIEKYGFKEKFELDKNDLLNVMDKCNMPLGVLQSEVEFGDYLDVNNAVKVMCIENPNRFIGFITVNPKSTQDPVELIEDALAWGCRGVNIEAWSYDLDPIDPYYLKVYEYCEAHNLIVTSHSSINFSVYHAIEHSHPRFLDYIACKYPKLKLVANHGGFPWVLEMVAVAWKHPQVYIEFGGVSPKYMGRPGTGWEPMLTYGNSQLKRQLLWATDWPVIDCVQSLEEFKALPLKEEVIKLALYGNASRLLGLE